ncbi:MAG: serine hydrolase domain-containing protein [Bacteroidota bacterium]
MRYLFLLCLLLSAKLFAQSDLESDLDSIMNKYHAVGLSVAVVKDGKLIYTKALGQKSLETGEALQTDDIFRIASISKSFSATSIMQLVKEGKLRLDDDVSDLVGFKVQNPKFPETVITLKMLLSHTSSINDSQGYFTLDPLNPDKNPNWAECYNYYKPGNGYQYCNLNFNLIGTIIEKYSGERFDQYVKNHILDPLGLYGGYCVDSLDSKKFASIYEYIPQQGYLFSDGAYHPRREIISNYEMGYSTPVFSPTGGIKSLLLTLRDT